MKNLETVSHAEQVALNQHINALNIIKGAIAPFAGKVVNKRLVDAVKATGLSIGWADDYAGRKEMTHYSRTKTGTYPEYYRNIIVPLVLEDGRLQLKETIEAIDILKDRLDQKYDDFAFSQSAHDTTMRLLDQLMKQARDLADNTRNSHEKEVMMQRIRRGY